MADPLSALTLWQPWGWSLFHGKPVENRPWSPPAHLLGKPFAIHGGKTYDREGEVFICGELGLDRLPPEAHAQGVLGVVVLDHVVSGETDLFGPGTLKPPGDPLGDSPWYFGPFGWALRDQVELRAPVPCRGMQGLWPLPTDVLELVRQRWAEARKP